MTIATTDFSAFIAFIALINGTTALLQNQDSRSSPLLGLLVCDDDAIFAELSHAIEQGQFDGQWQLVPLSDFSEMPYNQQFDLAVLLLTQPLAQSFNETVAMVNSTERTVAIQRCRDLFARHSLIFAPPEQDFIAFGFSKIAHSSITISKTEQAGELLGWQFNLFDYKQLPDWFNSRFWANPENWNKFRW